MTPIGNTSTITTIGTEPTPADLRALAAIGITPRTAVELAGLRRVTHTEARNRCGIKYKSDHLEGLAIPYLDPDDDRVLTWRIRRDNPEVDGDGKPIAKYLSSPDRKRLYFAPSCRPYLNDSLIPAIIVEAEKSVLAILDAETRIGRRHTLGIGTSGCWGWRGVTGKTTSPTGERVNEKGPLPCFNRVTWTNRDTIIVFDANIATNETVQAARRVLAADLTKRGAKVRVVDLPVEDGINGPDDYIGRHGAEKFFALVDAGKPITKSPSDRSARRSQAAELVDMALEAGIELWHTPAGDPYGTLQVDGHHEHHPLRRVVRDYLARIYYTRSRRTASAQALTDALGTLGGMARYDGGEFPVAVRLAAHGDALYLDLGGRDYRMVQIDAAGWRVVTEAPVRHWRPASLRPLPVPAPGGQLDALRELWPQVDNTAWTLSVSWLVAAMAPAGPYPVLVETGEQGSGKSTFGRQLRGLLDPAAPELRGVPRDERDVMIGALTSYVVALDNLSGLPVWLSDTLCRIATGGGLATRTLYSDLDETLIDVTRPILLTGIDSPATRGDLLDRSLVVTLPAMRDEDRADEAGLWTRYREMRPSLVGALCDATSMALRRRSEVQLDRRPRMADACTFVTAAEPALGWQVGRTVTTWMGARAEASADLIASDAVAQAVLALNENWRGTSTELQVTLNQRVSEATRTGRTWPATPRALSSVLRRLAPDLRRMGVHVELPVGARTARERIITIRQGCVGQDTQDSQDRSADLLSERPDRGGPVVCPVSATGHRQDTQQDSDPANKSVVLSDLSDVSCPLQPSLKVSRGRF